MAMAKAVIHSPMAGMIGGPRRIYIYVHLRTSQMVYSLKRTLAENILKEQLPYLGKKTVPATLRKDMWRSFAVVSFPSDEQALDAFQKLREFRKRHEHEWSLELMGNLEKAKRARLLQDQRANTVADIAAVMYLHEQVAEEHSRLAHEELAERQQFLSTGEQRVDELFKLKADARKTLMGLSPDTPDTALPDNVRVARAAYKQYKREMIKLKQQIRARISSQPQTAEVANSTETLPPTIPKPTSTDKHRRVARFTLDGIKVAWRDIRYAEYAESWPNRVIHDTLGFGTSKQRHIAAWTPTEDVEDDQTIYGDSLVRETPNVVVESANKESAMRRVVDRLRFGRTIPA